MLQKIIEELSSYSHWNISGTADTKKTSSTTEQFVQDTFVKHGYFVFKMGTQQAPDFFIMTKSTWHKIIEYNKVSRNKLGEIKYYKSGKEIPNKKPISKSIILNWENSKFNTDKIKILWISVKSRSKNNSYRVNDEQIKPDGKTIYINFDGLNQKVWVVIEKDIASNCGITQEKVEADNNAINECKLKLHNLWGKIYSPNTILRARGLSGNKMNINSSLTDITELFKSAGFSE